MWLVLCLTADEAARWAHAELERQGLAPIELVTDHDLIAASWEHRVSNAGSRTRLLLADGRCMDTDAIRAALNRFVAMPPALLAAVAPPDVEYAANEMSALVLSWLAGLGRSAINPASPRGLAGAWRPRTEWAMLAAAAGLPAAAAALGSVSSDQWPPAGRQDADVIVVGRSVFARSPLSPATRRACRQLSALADTPLLGLRFERDSEVFADAVPLPDLRPGGADLIAALAEELLSPAEA